jgi:hypothetical protein
MHNKAKYLPAEIKLETSIQIVQVDLARHRLIPKAFWRECFKLLSVSLSASKYQAHPSLA